MDLEDFVKDNPWAFADVIPVLWDATKYEGKIYAIPQDSEIRMFFYNKDMLRKIGKDDAFIEGLPAHGRKGRVHDGRTSRKLAKEVVDKGAAQIGIVHRPNAGPDYLMVFASFGVKFIDEQSGQLLLPKAEMQAGLEWFAWNAAERRDAEEQHRDVLGRDPGRVQDREGLHLPPGRLGGEGIPARRRQGRDLARPTRSATSTRSAGSTSPAAVKGGEPKNLSHPIVYVVNPKSKNAHLAAMLVAYATLPYYNTQHAVTTAHTAILNGQRSMPDYAGGLVPGGGDADAGALHLHPEPSRTSGATTASCSRRSRVSRPAG